MFIILNNRPLNIFRIQKVTDIIPLTPGKYKFTIETIKDQEYSNFQKATYEQGKEKYYGISQVLLNGLDKKYGVKGSRVRENGHKLLKTFDELNTEAGGNILDHKGNIGYYFVIWMLDSGTDSYICSKIYETEKDALEALRHLLATINEVTYNLPHVEI